MAEARRRLAAILAADVAGYSRLMSEDEMTTVAALNACRAIFKEHIDDRQGRVVDTAGDSVLAVFESAVEAVQAATAIQSVLATRDSDLPDHRRMRFRIGVNLGEIMEQADGTIYGDGVNVAARLEGLSQPGGVCVSGKVVDEVEGRTDIRFADIGEHNVKNIARPVRAFSIVTGTADPAAAAPATTAATPDVPSDKPSVAVLAFDNLSRDPEQEYFADGIAEDIITDISKISGLFVTARNSSFAYKGTSPNVSTVAKELGVRYVLEGSVRKAGDRVRINAQLIDGETGGHLWADRYDRQLDDIFEVQDEVTQKIVEALKVSLTPAEEVNIVHRGTANMDAYDAFMRGREWIGTWTQDGHAEARPWLEKAVEIDPNFADPLAYLAMISIVAYTNQWGVDWEAQRDTAHALATKAVSLDDLSPHAHYALGTTLLWNREFDDAMAQQKRALELDPNFALAYVITGFILHYSGESAAALEPLETAVRLDPMRADVYSHHIALCRFMMGEYAAAETALRQRIAKIPSTDSSRVVLAAALGHQGRGDEAKAVWGDLMALYPNFSFADRQRILPYKTADDMDRIGAGLRAAGIEV